MNQPKAYNPSNETNVLHITRCNTQLQNYIYNGRVIEVIKPCIGCILSRINLKTHETITYVVTACFTKKKGKNKDIIDLIYIEPIVDIHNDSITFVNSKCPGIIKLTNHGEWFSTTMRSQFEYSWNTYKSPRRATKHIPISKNMTNKVNMWNIICPHSKSI